MANWAPSTIGYKISKGPRGGASATGGGGGAGWGGGGMSSGGGGAGGGMGGYSPPPMPKPPQPPPPPKPMQMNFQQPQAQQYQPMQQRAPRWQGPGGGQLQQNLNKMTGYGEDFMDPESEYYQRMVEGMQESIGGQTEAKKRAAQLQAIYGGMGAGGGEMMQTQADIGQAGLEQMGGAAADLRMRAPQMGLQAMQSTFNPQMGLQGMQEQSRQFGGRQALDYARMGEQSRQFGAGLGEQQRQHGVGAGLQSQQMAQNAAMQQWQMQQQQQENMMRMMAGMF